MATLELQFLAATFLAGVLTFLAPCTLPLIPGYLGFLAGAAPGAEASRAQRQRYRWRLVKLGFFYVLGFSLVFIAVGTGIGLAGSLIQAHRPTLLRISGLLIIVLGLAITGLVKLPSLPLEGLVKVPERFRKPGKLSAFLFGVAFSMGWSPCVGPIVGSILTLSATAGGATRGALLLAVFSLGLALPFLVVAYSAGSLIARMERFERPLRALSIVGGLVLIFFGVLFLFNQFPAFYTATAGLYQRTGILEKLFRFF